MDPQCPIKAVTINQSINQLLVKLLGVDNISGLEWHTLHQG